MVKEDEDGSGKRMKMDEVDRWMVKEDEDGRQWKMNMDEEDEDG